MGGTGAYGRWLEALDVVIWLDPDVIVPGQGPVCGVEGAMEMKAYLEFVYEESRRYFEHGLTAFEASKRIDLGPYAQWRGAARLYLNVERAYREFRNESADVPWNSASAFDAVYRVAKARGIDVEF
jgi:hypothetical protein